MLFGRNGIGVDTMGWQIMGTDHLKPTDATTLSDEEVVEQAIDWLENAGMVLQPWQATAFRAIMLAHRQGKHIAVDPMLRRR